MKKYLTILLILTLCTGLKAAAQQQTEVTYGVITGKVVNRNGRIPISGAKVTITSIRDRSVFTDTDGGFTFEHVPYGIQKIAVEAQDFSSTEISVKVDQEVKNVNFISLAPAAIKEELDEGSFTEFEGENESASSGASQGSIALAASKDVFDNIAGYDFGTMRFRTRGYEGGSQDIYMNGIRMNDALTGNGNWSLWGGLNEATRNQEYVSGLKISDYGVGGINGVTNINARASQMRQGFRSSVVTANGQYRLRVMATYASGMQDNGWAYAFSVSTRQGGNDYVKGTGYNAFSYFASIEKQLNPCHLLSFTFFGAPTVRGAQMAATEEAYNLVGSNYYNPNWGYQDGKVRNARMRNYHEPVAMLNYYYEPNDNTKFMLSASFRFGRNGYSALDWYSADDPRPDYYRNLPSYYGLREEYNTEREIFEAWKGNVNGVQQIDWNRLYDVNRDNDRTYIDSDGNPIGSGLHRSLYIVSERHTDQRDFNLKAQLVKYFHGNINLNSGLDLRRNRSEYYTKVKDLLGGDYWLNVDNFADRDFPSAAVTQQVMNDINNPTKLSVKEGDKYGYDYYAHIYQAKLWGSLNATWGAFNLAAAADAGYTSFWREGLYRKGLFPANSFGDSAKQNFFTYTAKLVGTYHIGGRQSIAVSGIVQANAPYFQDAFISPRTRNEVVPNLTTEKVYGGDLSYSANFPFLKLRASAYYTKIMDQTKLISFYNDLQNGFTNFAMSGIDQDHIGVELGLQIPIYQGLSLSGAVSYGNYEYSSNPIFTQTRDNTAEVELKDERVYWKGYKVESTPQLASSIGLNYRTDSYWFFGIDCGYYDNMYLSMNPLLRTDAAIDGSTDEGIRTLTSQEKFDGAFLLNADIGKSWSINRKYNFGFSLQLKNLLNNTNIRTGGFEQMRLRDTTVDGTTTWSKFDSKYFYLYGTTYYLNLYLRF